MPDTADHTDRSFQVSVQEQLDSCFAELLTARENSMIKSAVYQIYCADKDIWFSGSAGDTRPGSGEQASVDLPFHTASIAKTLTAILILQLFEDGKLGPDGLQSTIASFGLFSAEIIRDLLVFEGQPCGGDITINQLLRHMSGMKDAMVDGADGLAGDYGGMAPDSLIGKMFANPDRAGISWKPWDSTKTDQADAGTFNFYLNSGFAKTPVNKPGEQFHYSDTGYVVLGLLAQHLTGLPLHRLYREWIFDPLGMASSYLAYVDDPELGPLRQPELEIWAGDMPCLTAEVNLSFDWAGGGLVSTTGDLIRLLLGVEQGACFKSAETRDHMMDWLTPPGIKSPRRAVGRGLFNIDGGIDGLIGHSGAWGGKMFYDPATRVFFGGSANQSQAPNEWFLPLVDVVNNALGQKGV